MIHMRPKFLALAAAAAALVVVSCDDPTRPATTGAIAPEFQWVIPAPGTEPLALEDPTTMRVQVIGATTKAVDLTKNAAGTFFVGKATGLVPGSYELIIEGLTLAGEVHYYGRVQGINVTRGATTPSLVSVAPTISTVSAPPLPNTTSFSQVIPFSAIAAATGYTVQVSTSAAFTAPEISFTTTSITPTVTVNALGTWHVRTRATLPGTVSTVPWSDSRSFQVFEAPGGRTEDDAASAPVDPLAPDTLRDRNLTPTQREDWVEIVARAGDSLFLETRAARLTPASPLNTILTLFQDDGPPMTQIATDDNGTGTNDSRIVVISPVTDTLKLRVTGASNTSGHYELIREIRRLPAAPTALSATVASGTQVDLTWTDNSDNESQFAIERCIGVACTNFAEVATVLSNVTSYSADALTQGLDYRWRVRARNGVGTSAYTAIVGTSTDGPAAPTALSAQVQSATRIDLGWVDNATNELAYVIERCTGLACDTFAAIDTVAANVISVADETVVFGQAYRYRVRATNNVVPSAYSNTADANTFPPATPTALVATVLGATRIGLAWTDNASDELGFRIERCLGDACSNFVEIATVDAGVASHVDSVGLAFNTGYRYRVRAYHVVAGVDYTNTANADTRPPTAPTSLTATTVSASEIGLNWTDSSDDETGFEIQRCIGGGCSNFTAHDTVAAGVVGYADTIGVVVNQSFSYRVVALGVPGNSAASNSSTANTLLPADPSALSATTFNSTRIDLAWTDGSTNETGFAIDRCSGVACTPTPLTTVGAGVTTYQDGSVVAEQTYRYRVRAFNIAGQSGYTSMAEANTLTPAAPSTLVATVVSGARIDLAWTNNTANATNVLVERCNTAACTDFAQIASLPAAQSTYEDFGVSINNSYRYRVRAANSANNSGYSNIADQNTIEPGAPSSLTATTTSATQIQLAWGGATGDGITGFELQRCTNAGCTTFAFLSGFASNVFTHNDNTVTLGNDYRYRVRAVNIVGPGAFSVIAEAETRVPETPTSLVATTLSGTSIGLSWTDNATDETGYLIERCEGVSCTPIVELVTIAASSVAHTDLTAALNTTYSYRVTAIGVPGNSTASNTATANTLVPADPTNIAATTISATQIDVVWTDVADNETGYTVQRCSGVGCGTFAHLANLPAGATAHSDTTVGPGVSYSYQVRAFNIAGPSNFNGPATANTFAPAAPSALTATTQTGSSILLGWTNNAPDATEMRIERCSADPCTDPDFVEIDVVPASQTLYDNNGGSFPVQLDSAYTYRVRAQNAADVSAYSNTASAHTLQPSAPNPATATTAGPNQVDLTWTQSIPDVTGYQIYRCDFAGCTNFTLFTGFGAAVFAAIDATVTPGNDYRYLIRASNAAQVGPFSDTLNVNTRTPATPTGLAAQVLTGLVRLTWTDNADNDLATVVLRCAGAACVPVDVDTIPTVDLATWDDSSVVANTEYTYQVRAENSVGASAASAAAFANTLIAAPVTVLSATAVSPTQIDLAWTPSASQGTGLILNYNIYRCNGTCDPATGALLVALPADSAAYDDTSVAADTSYTYVVVPRTAFGETAIPGSATATASTKLPVPPSGLVGTLMSPTSIQLVWSNNSSNETGFEVAQCAGIGCTSFVTVATTGVDVANFLADTLTFGVRYRFIVRAVNTAGASAWSDTLETGTTVPAAPTDLAAFITDGVGTVRLLWTDASADEGGFEIDSCTGAGCVSWVLLTTAAANATQADVGPVGPGTYRYRIRAVNAAGTSAPSIFAEITAGAPYAAPIGALATTTGPTSILLTWTDQTNNETTFGIFRCTGGACDPLAGALVDSVARDSTSFVDATVTTGSLYRYAVVATNGFGTLASAAFDGNTMPPDAPGTLSGTTISDAEISLAWTDGGPYETGYVIERCVGAACTDFAPIDTVPANFVSFSDVGLTPNATYRYRVQAINAVAASAYSNIVEKVTDIPATPTGLSALAMTLTRIDLAWTDNATNETFYIVERCAGTCDGSGTFVEIETGLAPGSQAFSDLGVSAGLTYSYRVRALNVGGVSPYTNIATATTAAPIDPTGLAVTTLSGTSINLTWTDNATNELSYQVERCTSAACPTFTLRTTLAADATGYVDTVAVDDAYTYRVRAVNNVGPSGYTLEATANTFLPAAATDFTVVTVSGTRIDLTWTDNATNEDGYVLERCSGAGCSDFTLLDSLPLNASGYQNDGIAAQTSFTYRLYGYNIAGQSAIAGPSTATTITPAAPTGLSSVLAAPGQIDLTWTDNANNETQYRVERCSAGTTKCATADSMAVYAVEIATLLPDVTFHSDGGLAPTTLYFYRVRATNVAGSSPYSAIISRSTSVPPAPTGLGSFTVLANRVDLFWSDASANEEGFRVERCIGPDPCTVFTQIAQLTANTTTFIDSTITANPAVYYRVIAFNGGGGNASNVAFASTIVPAAPTAFVAVANGQAAVNLSWTDNASDETGFYLERCTGPGCSNFVPLDTLAINAVAYADLAVAADNVYRYRLRAFGNGHSDYTAIASVATVLPNAATDLVATAISDTRVDLTWTDNTPTDSLWNETEFQVYRCEGPACAPTAPPHASVGRDTAYFSDSLLTPGVAFSYHVVAVSSAGAAAASNVATAATTVPAIPTSLTDSTVSATGVLLRWLDNAVNEDGYEIERCEGTGCSNFAPVDTAAAGATTILADGLVGSVAYQFRIRAFNANGSSGYSNIVLAQSDMPPAPTALAGATVSSTQVNLSWTDNAGNETAYIVERCDGTGCTSFVAIDSLAADVLAYQNVSIAIDTAYVYRVRASNAAGTSAYSNAITVSTYRPQTPAAIAATPISATRVDLAWTDVAVNDTVIIVERCLGFGCVTFADIDSLAPDATAFSDTTVTVNNTYNYRLRAENAAGASAPTAAVEVGTFIPSDPSGLSATTNSPTQITLNWADNSTTELDFRIDRCVGLGCTVFDSLVVVAASAITYADLSVTLGNSYSYRVIARGGGGNSNPSNAATSHTFPAGAVSSLTASPLTATTLQLSWSAADFASLYQIDTVSGVDTTLFALVSSGVTDTVVTVPTGLVYNFVVRASNASGSGAYAGTALAMTPPPAPVDLSVFPLTSTQATLAWSDTSARETSFEVQRSFFSAGSFGGYTTVATLGADVTSHVDAVPVTGRYKYRVRAANQVGAGAFSNEVDLTLSAPVAPSGLGAAVTAPGQITLTWTDNSDSEQSFSIERSVSDNLTFSQVATVGPGVQTHVDSSGLAINTTYFYRVRAVNNIGASGYTNEASTATTVPSPVTSLTTTILSSTSIQLNWNGVGTTGELGFRVYRCVGGSCVNFTLLDGSLPADAITYTDVTASYGDTLRYQVRPYNLAGEPTGNQINTRPLVLPAPVQVFALPFDRTTMRVRWNATQFTWETGFEVERCAGSACTDFASAATAAVNDSLTLTGGLTANGSWYRFRVRAVADGNAGPWSAVVLANTPKEIVLGDTLISTTSELLPASNMTHYVVAMPAGSSTVEFAIGLDPGGTTTSGGSYLLVARGQGIQRFASQLISTPPVGDTLCSARNFLNATDPFINATENGGCSLNHLGVTTDYYITTYSNAYTNLYLTALPGPTTYTFNNCTQAGRLGPAQGQCDAAYTGTPLQGQVVVADSGVQNWTVPFSGRWAITAVGAAGASATPGFNGGRGARIYGEFVLTAGQNMRMAVGQMGSGVSSGLNGGGGGGSFVYNVTGATPLLIAGGGGGTRGAAAQNGCDASITAFAIAGSGGTSTSACTVKGDGAGNGGIVSSVSWGSAGAGFNTNGGSDSPYGSGGSSWTAFIVGGADVFGCGPGPGGFGGGGSGGGCNGGGGGGGYSGGDGGWIAGGGGSFNAGTNTAATPGIGTAHGTIIFKYLGPN